MLRHRLFVYGACAVALLILAAWAGTARAQGSFAISLSGCGAPDGGFAFTINGAGADPDQALEVDITSSEAGAFTERNVLLPVGVVDANVMVAATIGADGTFAFPFSAGSAQLLPAAIAVYTYDATVDARTPSPFYTTTVDRNTPCTDGTSLALAGSITLPKTPTECKKNAWRAYRVFKNEGDCVSFVATRGRNKPALLP